MKTKKLTVPQFLALRAAVECMEAADFDGRDRRIVKIALRGLEAIRPIKSGIRRK